MSCLVKDLIAVTSEKKNLKLSGVVSPDQLSYQSYPCGGAGDVKCGGNMAVGPGNPHREWPQQMNKSHKIAARPKKLFSKCHKGGSCSSKAVHAL